jgi:hypothetical protein
MKADGLDYAAGFLGRLTGTLRDDIHQFRRHPSAPAQAAALREKRSVVRPGCKPASERRSRLRSLTDGRVTRRRDGRLPAAASRWTTRSLAVRGTGRCGPTDDPPITSSVASAASWHALQSATDVRRRRPFTNHKWSSDTERRPTGQHRAVPLTGLERGGKMGR